MTMGSACTRDRYALAAALLVMILCTTHVGHSDAYVHSRARQRRSQSWSLSSAVVSTDEGGANDITKRKFMRMTPEEDALLKSRGDHEASLIGKVQPLQLPKLKVSRKEGGSGFGGRAVKNSKQQNDASQDPAKVLDAHAESLHREGLVRIDSVLSFEFCEDLRNYLVDLRKRATVEVESGAVENSLDRFADVLLNQNRCDLKIPLGAAPVHAAIHCLLDAKQSILGPLIGYIYDRYGRVGRDATLYELNCFMSNRGARRQLLHSDVMCVDTAATGLAADEPILLTVFVALQDVDVTMGPTVFIPRTHNERHKLFYQSTTTDSSGKDKLLQSIKNTAVMNTLPQGAAVLFDPRTLHCATENTCEDPDHTRCFLYLTFKNPLIDSPGCPSCAGYGVSQAELGLAELWHELDEEQKSGKRSWRLQALGSFP